MNHEKVLQGSKYPAKQHARRVVEYIRNKVPGASGIIFLQSRSTKKIEDCDQEEPFRCVAITNSFIHVDSSMGLPAD